MCDLCLCICTYYRSYMCEACGHLCLWECAVFCMEDAPAFSLSYPCLLLGSGQDCLSGGLLERPSRNLLTQGSEQLLGREVTSGTSRRPHTSEAEREKHLCVCVVCVLLCFSWILVQPLMDSHLALAWEREAVFQNWKICFYQNLYPIDYAVLVRVHPETQIHSRWSNRKTLPWRIIYELLEMTLKQPGEGWVSHEIRKCRKLLLLLGQEGRPGEGSSLGDAPGAERGRSTCFLPFSVFSLFPVSLISQSKSERSWQGSLETTVWKTELPVVQSGVGQCAWRGFENKMERPAEMRAHWFGIPWKGHNIKIKRASTHHHFTAQPWPCESSGASTPLAGW